MSISTHPAMHTNGQAGQARPAPVDWQSANRATLLAALDQVKARLQRAAGVECPDDESLRTARRLAEQTLTAPGALQQVTAAFNLSPFEEALLLLCAGPDLDPEFGRLLAELQGSPDRAWPTLSLAMTCLPQPHWSALAPAAPLRSWRLVEVQHDLALTQSPLRLDERILHFLMGINYVDERLAALLQTVETRRAEPETADQTVRQMAALLDGGTTGPPVIALHGGDAAARRRAAARTCAARGLVLYRLAGHTIPAEPEPRDAMARLLDREAIMAGAALIIELDDEPAPRWLAEWLDQMAGPIFLSARWPAALQPDRDLSRVALAPTTDREQHAHWRQTLAEWGVEADELIPALTAQFRLSPAMIRAACSSALAGLEQDDAVDQAAVPDRLWAACRAQARPRLDDVAQRMVSQAGWDDLVLPAEQLATLHEIAASVRNRHTVYARWGFAARSPRGLGAAVVFAGPSGTGKTLAAEVLANALRLDLYRVDLSAVVSKYIGETEKNLRRIFDAAEHGGAILLFDEADALFGKRSEVKDSHDRYANIEVSFLLQQMEAYQGLAVLTTNQFGALDSAFLRRLRFVVQFPFPTAAQRAQIWTRIFPPETPTRGLDAGKLARLHLAGGNIRNVALNAAFLAADAGEPVGMDHILQATRSEFIKLERPLTEADVAGWLASGKGPAAAGE